MTRPLAFLTPALCAFAIALPHSAVAQQTVDPKAGKTAPVFEVVKTGDRSMTCPALSSEINALAATEYAPAAEVPKKKKKKSGFGVLKVLGSAAPMLGGFGGMGGALGSSALSAASSASAASAGSSTDSVMAARAAANPAAFGPSPQTQRKLRLMTIFESKRC